MMEGLEGGMIELYMIDLVERDTNQWLSPIL
jgi:hypothetical protein